MQSLSRMPTGKPSSPSGRTTDNSNMSSRRSQDEEELKGKHPLKKAPPLLHCRKNNNSLETSSSEEDMTDEMDENAAASASSLPKPVAHMESLLPRSVPDVIRSSSSKRSSSGELCSESLQERTDAESDKVRKQR